MTIFRQDIQPTEYEETKNIEFSWDDFRGGLNTLLRDTEIEENELARATNIILIGKGVPTKRWGTAHYYISSATGSVRGLKGYYKSDGTNELLAITDEGFLTIKSSASYTIRAGASWASGYNSYMAQLEDKMYISNEKREMVRYSSPTVYSFPTLALPTSVLATQISGASGTNTYSYRISTLSSVGETLASDGKTVANQPQSLTDGTVKVSWTAPSTASGVLEGFNVYGRTQGDERFLGSVDKASTDFLDDGSATPFEFTFPPTADSTGGIKAKYVIRFADRLIFAGIDGEPSKVVISGRVPNQEKFDLANGGNFVRIEPDAGDDITGLGIFRERIIVFKERSIWQITLSTQGIGYFYVTIPTPTLLTASHGCVSQRSIAPVENDLFFLSRGGVYVLGYEPNIAIDVLRSNELSVKVRPLFDGLTAAQRENAVAIYHDFKYIISFPGKNQSMVFDRERGCWVGPWTKDTRVFESYKDSSGDYHLLYGEDDDPNVKEYDENAKADEDVAITTRLITKKHDFGDWSVFKILRDVFVHLKDVVGTVAVNIDVEKRSGKSVTIKSFSVTDIGSSGSAGWGADTWGNNQWGDSEEQGTLIYIVDLVRHALFRGGKLIRNIQVDIRTLGKTDKYELLGLRGKVRERGTGFKRIEWKV